MKTTLALLAGFATSVSAHTIFQQLWVNGQAQGHLTGIRAPDYDGPIMDVNSNDMICNGGINPYHKPVSTSIVKVPAGAQVTAEWHHTLSGAVSGDADEPIAGSHKGPILAYLAKVPSALQSSVTGLKWFKIYHDGLNNGAWAVDKLIQNKGKVSFTIPSCIAPGQYLLRVELIALHSATKYPGAQFYMECAQIEITGGGNVSPATVSIPGIYHGSDPGVTVNIYNGISKYTIPGPSVFTCSAGGGGGSAPSSGAVAQYGQCGGIGYTGGTACASPYTCHFVNDYYSQCL